MPDLASLSALTAYALLFALVFAESGILLGFFLPGDTVLFAAGLLSGGEHPRLSLAILLPVVLTAAVAGDTVGYWFGAKAGPPLLARREGTLQRAERFYERYGAFAVVAGRWIPWVRTLTPILAGAARMPYRTFLPANIVGALCWGAGLLVLGHLAAATPLLKNITAAVAVAFVAASVVAATVRALRSRRPG